VKYIVDTSVLSSVENALTVLESKHIVISTKVIENLGKLKASKQAANTLSTLDGLKEQLAARGTIITPAGGSITIADTKDRTLDFARSLESITLLTNDLAQSILATTAGIKVEHVSHPPIPTGTTCIYTTKEKLDEYYTNKYLKDEWEIPANTNIIIKAPGSSALGTKKPEGIFPLKEVNPFEIKPRSAEQRFAINMMMDKELEIVSLLGSAGVGKSLLALACGLEQVVNHKAYDKIIVFRPLYAVGNQDLGFLPGTAEEKMAPWESAVYDALQVFCNDNVIDYITTEKIIEVLPLTNIRGRTLNNAFIIFDEVQNYESDVILTSLSRLGEGSKAILTYDPAQSDNKNIPDGTGIVSVIKKLIGNNIVGHIQLSNTERSVVAELASKLL
jgi:PhoH-like ATPase